MGRTRALAEQLGARSERSGDGRAMSGSTEWLGTTGGCENRRGGAPTTCLRGRFARALGERSGNSDSAISRGGVLGVSTDTGRVDRLQGGSVDNEKSRARSQKGRLWRAQIKQASR